MLVVFHHSEAFLRSATALLERATGIHVVGVDTEAALDDVLASNQTIAAAVVDASARTMALEISKKLVQARPAIVIALLTYDASDEVKELVTEHGLMQFDKVEASADAMASWARVALRASEARHAWRLHALAKRAREWKFTAAQIDVVKRALEGDPAIKSIARGRGSRASTVSSQVGDILERSKAPSLRSLVAGLLADALKLATEHAARTYPDLVVPPPPDLSARSPRARRPSRRAPRDAG